MPLYLRLLIILACAISLIQTSNEMILNDSLATNMTNVIVESRTEDLVAGSEESDPVGSLLFLGRDKINKRRNLNDMV